VSVIPGRRAFLRTGLAAGAALMAGGRLAVALPSRDSGPPVSTGGASDSRPVWLPQNDPRPVARRLQLLLEQRLYQYEYSYISPLAMLRQVPLSEQFSQQFLVLLGSRILDLLENLLARRGEPRALSSLRTSRRMFDDAAGASTVNAPRLLDVLQTAIGARASEGRPHRLEDYAALFRTIGLPPIAEDFQDDEVFALMRVAGPNPLMLERLPAPDDRFPVSDAMFRRVLPGDSLAAAAAEGRLYLADYKILQTVEASSFPVAQKYTYAPLALFAVEQQTGDLVPVAIQCHQEPGPENPVFTPQDGWSWMIAKTVVEIADGNVHEMVSHLGRTHLALEPFAIATHRQLAPNHPLGVLLRPHFEGTFAINDLARLHLVNKGGPVDALLSGTIESSLALAATGVRTWVFDRALPPETFRARGVDDVQALPHYPYRDDALLYWAALRRWTAGYLSLYYQTEADLRNDYELAGWAREIVSQRGGRVVGFGQEGGITSRDYLADATALILFTASVQHAAVNFPQLDLMTYTPNMPLAGYTSAPGAGGQYTEQDFLDILPPLGMADLQLAVLYILGSIHYTRLGEYRAGYFSDPRVQPPLAAFQQELDEIGAIIDERNLRRRPYEFLARAGIPQSINV